MFQTKEYSTVRHTKGDNRSSAAVERGPRTTTQGIAGYIGHRQQAPGAAVPSSRGGKR